MTAGRKTIHREISRIVDEDVFSGHGKGTAHASGGVGAHRAIDSNGTHGVHRDSAPDPISGDINHRSRGLHDLGASHRDASSTPGTNRFDSSGDIGLATAGVDLHLSAIGSGCRRDLGTRTHVDVGTAARCTQKDPAAAAVGTGRADRSAIVDGEGVDIAMGLQLSGSPTDRTRVVDPRAGVFGRTPHRDL